MLAIAMRSCTLAETAAAIHAAADCRDASAGPVARRAAGLRTHRPGPFRWQRGSRSGGVPAGSVPVRASSSRPPQQTTAAAGAAISCGHGFGGRCRDLRAACGARGPSCLLAQQPAAQLADRPGSQSTAQPATQPGPRPRCRPCRVCLLLPARITLRLAALPACFAR